jgi:hypothetical protein
MQDDPLLEKPRHELLPGGWRGRPARRAAIAIAGVLLAFVLLYYPIGMLWVHRVDDDPSFGPGEVAPGASRAVAVAAALIEREVDLHAWTANDPFFLPGALLDNMPNFQQGIIAALGRFTVEMLDQIGRVRGTSQADPDLDKAAGLLEYSGTIWIFDFSTSWAPTASSESQYRAARRALLAYNERLATGRAVFERRADDLIATLERMAADLGSASAQIDRHLHESAGAMMDFEVDDIFYNVKGRLYAYALLLRELGDDFGQLIADRETRAVWDHMLESMTTAATLQPWVILNGRPDSQLVPSHLAAQGFYLLRARFQLYEIVNILQK